MEDRELRLGSGWLGLGWVFAQLATIIGFIVLAVRWQEPHLVWIIIPLGAICTLASLSSQNVTPRVQRDSGPSFVRQQVVDCSNKSPSEVCVISFDSETSAR